MRRIITLLGLAIAVPAISAHAAVFPAGTPYDLCFTPGHDCTSLIVNEIRHARHLVNVQAFVVTSEPIEQALAEAHRHGVDVRIILDKTQEPTSAAWFSSRGIPVWIDDQVAIAHNKVMVIDDATVITGSFNFTTAAQFRNAENVLIIHDRLLAGEYLINWENRQKVSTDYHVIRISHDRKHYDSGYGNKWS